MITVVIVLIGKHSLTFQKQIIMQYKKNYEKIHRFNNEQHFLDKIKQPLENQKYNFR